MSWRLLTARVLCWISLRIARLAVRIAHPELRHEFNAPLSAHIAGKTYQ